MKIKLNHLSSKAKFLAMSIMGCCKNIADTETSKKVYNDAQKIRIALNEMDTMLDKYDKIVKRSSIVVSISICAMIILTIALVFAIIL